MGYRVSAIAFNPRTGEPTAAADSVDALTDIMTNPDHSQCPGDCFRPAGLAVDAAGRVWMTSDTTGEIYVLQKLDNASPTATASSTIVTATGGPSSAAAAGWRQTKAAAILGWGATVVVGGWLALF